MSSGNKRLRALLTLSAAGALLGAAIPSAVAQSQAAKTDGFIEHQIDKGGTKGWSHVIAHFDTELTDAQKQQLRGLNCDIYRNLPFIKSVALAVPTRNLKPLAALAFVRHLSTDASVRKLDQFTVDASGAGVAFTQNRLTGTGVTVAVIDSGVIVCPDLSNSALSSSSSTRVIAQVNFVPNESSFTDTCGHGTHVAGIVAGNGAQSSGPGYFRTFYGIARQAQIASVRVLDKQGRGTVSAVISGIQWAISNKAKYNIRVINLSIGHPVGESYQTDPLCQAVESAWNSGIVVVCAAGNSGRLQNVQTSGSNNEGYGAAYGSIQCPGNDPYVITVGAMKDPIMQYNADGSYTHNRSLDRIATYSSRGPGRIDLILKPDLVAPGNRVISLEAPQSFLATNYDNLNSVNWNFFFAPGGPNPSFQGVSREYFQLSGTSMSAPVVSGAVALMLQDSPGLTPNTVKARLMISADKWTDPWGMADPCTYGAGYLNIPAALACSATPTQAALSPSMSIDAKGNVYINMDRAVWGTDINGQMAVWGVSSVNDLRAVWGTNAIWGNSLNILNASQAIWGQNVWSDRAIWGASTSAADLSSTALQGD